MTNIRIPAPSLFSTMDLLFFLVTPSHLISAGTELSRRWKKSTPSTSRTGSVQVKVESDANPIGLRHLRLHQFMAKIRVDGGSHAGNLKDTS